MPTTKKNVSTGSPAKPKRATVQRIEMVQLSLPKPLPKGVTVVYDETLGDYFIRTTTLKSMRALLDGIWAGFDQWLPRESNTL